MNSSSIPIHVVGMGLDGPAGLPAPVRDIVNRATVLVGSDRHLRYFPQHPAHRIRLDDLHRAIQAIQTYRVDASKTNPLAETPLHIVVLASGDPLFFGIGRLLLTAFTAEQITFHPHLSSVQLAFNRIKLPWHDAHVVSAHGRSLDELQQALQRDRDKIAVLTDGVNTPVAIARLIRALDRPHVYHIWVCENLAGADERIQPYTASALAEHDPDTFSALNVVILHRQSDLASLPPLPEQLPVLGIPDSLFAHFGDRPGLMTKREIRMLILGELSLKPGQIMWDIGAGTGSVSIEAARLCPDSDIYAVEKTTAGIRLIQANMARFKIKNVVPVQGVAPEALTDLPRPHQIFIGGSGGQLTPILNHCLTQLDAAGTMVIALATLQHLNEALHYLECPNVQSRLRNYRLLLCQLAHSVPMGHLTRLAPLNPIHLLTLRMKGRE